jgi:hypothetical protein
MTQWSCSICATVHENLPTCFGVEAPWRGLVPAEEFDARVELTEDQCVVDEQHFFVRGHVQIPVHGSGEPLEFSVWSSLSEESFCDMALNWDSPERTELPPYFGWLCTPVWVYPGTIHLPLSVQCRERGLTPIFTVTNFTHPLAVDQQNGITIQQWHEMAQQLLIGTGQEAARTRDETATRVRVRGSWLRRLRRWKQ